MQIVQPRYKHTRPAVLVEQIVLAILLGLILSGAAALLLIFLPEDAEADPRMDR